MIDHDLRMDARPRRPLQTVLHLELLTARASNDEWPFFELEFLAVLQSVYTNILYGLHCTQSTAMWWFSLSFGIFGKHSENPQPFEYSRIDGAQLSRCFCFSIELSLDGLDAFNTV